MGDAELKEIDSALVENARDGDEAALAALVDQVQSRLFRFCIHISGDQAHAEDLCQETLVKALQQLGQLQDPKSFLGWTFRIAKNVFLDGKRRFSSSREVQEDTASEDSDGPVREAEDTSQRPADEVLPIREALKSLNENDRLVLVLIDMEEYSYQEAAEIIGISENAVRSRLHRARRAFLKLFNEG